jgi:hypothetical protein
MDPFYQVVQDEPKWYKWVDSAVLLIAGVLIGLLFAYSFQLYEYHTAAPQVEFIAPAKTKPAPKSTDDVIIREI